MVEDNGRVGVLRMLHTTESGNRQIIVVQSSAYPQPPRTLPQTIRDGETTLQAGEAAQMEMDGMSIRVSCLHVQPLGPTELEPPDMVQSRLREFCERRRGVVGTIPMLGSLWCVGRLERGNHECCAFFSIDQQQGYRARRHSMPLPSSALVADMATEELYHGGMEEDIYWRQEDF